MKRILALCIALVLLAAVIAGCASASKSTADSMPTSGTTGSSKADYDWSYREEQGEVAVPPDPEPKDATSGGNGFSSGGGKAPVYGDDALVGEVEAKVIKTGYLGIETLEFEETTDEITRQVQMQGGFIASSNIEGVSRQDKSGRRMRKANFQVRIPSKKFEQFLTDIGQLGNIIRDEKWGEDISGKYYDTEARLKSLTIQEDRLLAILMEAEELKYILELERELASVRYEIENLTGTLRKWDNLVAYSTVNIDVYEVKEIEVEEPEPITIWEKIANGFSKSIKSVSAILEFMAVFLISALPFLVLFGAIGFIVMLIVKRVIKPRPKDQQ
jgi:hypothetical protein